MNNKVDVQINGGGGIVPCTYKTVILKPNFVGQKNMLTQTMMNERDTKYVIKYDYTIGGGITGVVNVHYVSPFENRGWEGAHEAWIAADNAYTNNPNETTLAAKNATYAALQNTPRYYYYDRKQVVVRAGKCVEVPNGCILFSTAGAQVEFPNGVAEVDTVVYICNLIQGDYEYSLTNAIVMPDGCLIEFDGGSISDGIIVCNNTIFVYNQPEETVLKNIELSGDYEMNAGGGNADKKDNTNGMGKIILRKNKGFAEQLTQENTIYVIQYDFDLGGESVTIPENCVLEFDGGSLKNGGLQASDNVYLNKPLLNEVHVLLGNNNTVEGGVIHNENYNCIEIKEKNNVTIRNSKVSTTKGTGEQKRVSPIYIKNSSNISIHNCTISGSKWDSYGEVTNFYQDPACPIYAYNADNIDIEECEMFDSICECVYIVESTHLRCLNNHIHDVGYSCIAAPKNTDVTITGNHCYNSGASCITAQSNKFIISNNIVHDNNSGNGITAKHSTDTANYDIDYTSGVVCGNIIYDFVNAGIASSETRFLIIAENEIHDGKQSEGVGDNGESYGIRIRTDIYDDNSGEKRQFIRANIVNNTITNVYSGIYCNIYYDNESEIIVSNNTIVNCTAYGLLCNNGKLIVTNNNFDGVRECVKTSCSSHIANNTADNIKGNAFIFFGNIADKQFIEKKKREVRDRTSFNSFIKIDTNLNERLEHSIEFNIKNNIFISKTGAVPLIKVPNNSLNLDNINCFYLTENTVILNTTITNRDSIINIGTGNNISIFYLNNIHNTLYLATDRVGSRANLPVLKGNVRYYPCYVEDETRLLIWNGFNWTIESILFGDFEAAESLITNNKINITNSGTEFYLNDRKKPIYYGGDSKWYDYDGAVATAKRSGDNNNRPIAKNTTSTNGQLTRDVNEGFTYYDTELNKPIVAAWISTSNANVLWKEFDSAKAGVNRHGVFADKPAAADIYIGFMYMRTDGANNTKYPIYYGGDSKWYDATGSEVTV